MKMASTVSLCRSGSQAAMRTAVLLHKIAGQSLVVVANSDYVMHTFRMMLDTNSRVDAGIDSGIWGDDRMPKKRKLIIVCGLAGIACLAAMIAASTRSVAVTAATAGSVVYHYDSLGRIVQDSYPANAATYTYDNAGNRTQATIQ
jgi:YD repeat-containing protein